MNEAALDFDNWYRNEYPRVLVSVSVVCGGNHARAEDATNDAFAKAFERWDSVSEMQSPTGWVTKVAINRAKRGLRRRTRRIELLNAERMQTPVTNPETGLDLWDSLSSLTPRQRKAIVLRYIEDLPQQQVANEMGVAVGTASATLSQARGHLRSELQKGDSA